LTPYPRRLHPVVDTATTTTLNAKLEGPLRPDGTITGVATNEVGNVSATVELFQYGATVWVFVGVGVPD